MQAIGGSITPARKKHGRTLIESEEDLAKKYPSNCSFYLDPPTESITLQKFEDYAVARLHVLRTIERINLTSHAKYSLKWANAISHEFKNSKILFVKNFYLLLEGEKSKVKPEYEDMLEARKVDYISHFLLRLAFCRSDDLRKWMTTLEVDFFRAKMLFQNFPEFKKLHQLNYKQADVESDKKLKEDLLQANFSLSDNGAEVFEVPFTDVLDLVKTRKVLLRNGNAFVPFCELGAIVSISFRSKLSQYLALTSKAMTIVEEDERLVRLLTDFDKRHTGSTYVASGSQNGVTAEMLENLSKKSFPLCMKNLHDVVIKEHHLKHWGRLQLGLFFKGINLSMEESTKFWRSNFVKKAGMEGSRFDKQYLYNIRHMYGQEGKRADYTPYSCMKVIMSSVGPGDHHGCPFRHSDAVPLRVKLVDAMIPAAGIKEIMELVEAKHYQIACQKYFEWTHNKSTIEGGLNHPNQYFEESQAVVRGKVKPSGPTATTSKMYYNKVKTESEPRTT